MKKDLPAWPAKITCSWGRKVDSTSKMGSQPSGSQGTPEGGMQDQPQVTKGKKEPEEDSDKGDKGDKDSSRS